MIQEASTSKWHMLLLTSLAVVFSLTSWFAATAILDQLSEVLAIPLHQAAWLTNAVQIGFVTGALAASVFSVADIAPLPRILSFSSLLAAASTAVLLLEPGFAVAMAARFVTGVALAGVYPSAMKLIATWFVTGRGLALGTMVGALTLGSAMPHLFRSFENAASWKAVILLASGACVLASLLFITLVKEGPHAFPKGRFDPRQIGGILRNKPIMLANFGYFGHMWELYAMWGWILAYSNASLGQQSASVQQISLLAFLVVAAGTPGCLFGGWLSDRIGRCLTTIMMMAASACCALVIGFLFDGPLLLFIVVALVWGFSIVGDSAQFSTAVSELSSPDFVGSSLAFQMAVGFAITVVAIWLVPIVADVMGGWQWSFIILLPGPVIGIIAMLSLRAHPEAVKLAGGLR